MPKTQIKQRETFYNRLMREDAENVNAGQEYKKILASLRNLMEKTDSLDQKNGEMSPEDYIEISKIYRNLYRQCEKHIEEAKTPFDMSRNNIVKELKRVLGKDMTVLSKMDREHPGNYQDAVRDARTVKVDVTGKELKTKGDALSTRIPVKFTNGKKGFFTKPSYFDQEEQWKDLVQEYSLKFPKGFAKGLNRLITDHKFRYDFACQVASVHPRDDRKIMEMLEIPNEFMGMALLGAVENDNRMKTFREFLYDADGISNALDVTLDGAGIPLGSRLDQRNVAMSSVAKLIHCEDLLAESTSMEMIQGAKKYQGTFMETAEGVDIYNLEFDSPFRKYEDTSFQNPKLYEKLGNLQALDYICGNVDRHQGNMLYTFDQGEPPKIIDIKGIDNDLSFGTKTFDKPKDMMMRLAHPEQMGLLSEKTAMTIMALNEDVLKTVLMDKNLSKEEMDAAWKRTQNLQTAIKDKKITLVKDGQWKEAIDSFEPKKYQRSQFAALRQRLIERRREISSWKTKNAVGHAIPYSEVYSEQFHTNIKSRIMDLKEKENAIRKLDRHFGSKEFDAMRDSLYKLSKEYTRIDKMLENQQSPDQKEIESLQELQEALVRNTQDYVNAKKLLPTTERGRVRLEVAKALQDIVLDAKEFQFDEPEKKVNENVKAEKDDSKNDLDEMENDLMEK